MNDHSLYVGTIEHRRLSPVRNEFTYSVFYFYLDVDSIQDIFNKPLLMSYNSPGLFSFWRKDYIGERKNSLRDSITELIFKKTGDMIDGPIKLLTNISYLGFCFNPVSFYYCYERDGRTLKYIVSEVTNTPWGERHQHVLKCQDTNKDKQIFRLPKDFHVSPFMPMTIDYTWVMSKSSDSIYILMQNRNSGEKELIFDSTLELQKKELSFWSVIKYSILIPFVTFKTMFAIYYQAGKLYIKGSPFYTHPAKEKSS